MNISMLILANLCLAGMGICVVLFVKNELVYWHRTHASDLTHEISSEIIDSGKYSRWREAWKIKDSYPDYASMLFNPFIWTFNQAYPDLEKRLREL